MVVCLSMLSKKIHAVNSVKEHLYLYTEHIKMHLFLIKEKLEKMRATIKFRLKKASETTCH